MSGHVIGYTDSPEFGLDSHDLSCPVTNLLLWNMRLVKLEFTVWYRFNSIPVTCIPCYALKHQTACHIDCNLCHVMIETAVTTRTPLLPASSARDVSSTLRSTPCKQLQTPLCIAYFTVEKLECSKLSSINIASVNYSFILCNTQSLKCAWITHTSNVVLINRRDSMMLTYEFWSRRHADERSGRNNSKILYTQFHRIR